VECSSGTASNQRVTYQNDENGVVRIKARATASWSPWSAMPPRSRPASGLQRPTAPAEKLLEVPQGLIRTALDLELADGAVIADMVGAKRCVFLAGLYRAERGIAERLLQLRTGKLPSLCGTRTTSTVSPGNGFSPRDTAARASASGRAIVDRASVKFRWTLARSWRWIRK